MQMKFFLILFLFFCNSAFAQDSVYTLPPVEITATRPVNNFQSFEVLNEDEIQNFNPGISLEETFAKVPGVIIGDRNNPSLGDKISIRGIGARSSFGVRGIKILADNIPLTLPDGQSQTNNIDIFSSGRVEILKGPASSFYGNAAGGVINFQTEIPEGDALNAFPEVIFGGYDLQKYSLKLSGQYNSQSYLVSFNNLNYSGFRDHSEKKTYHLNTVYRNNFSDEINFTGVINYFNSPYLLNPGSLDREAIELDRNSVREFNKLQGTGEKADQLQTGATLNYAIENFRLETTLYYVTRDLINPIPGRIIELDRKAGGFRSFFNKKIFMNEFEIDFSGGVDVEYQNDLRKEYENDGLPHTQFQPAEIFENLNYGNKLIDQEENVLGIGPFISLKFILNENLGLLTGLRYDHYTFKVDDPFTQNSGKRKMTQLSPAAGIFFKPGLSLRVFFNYSTSFLTPTTSELSNRPGAAGGFNPDLNPETISQFELGTEYFFREWNTSLSAAIYFLTFDNLIIPFQIQNSEEVFFRNAGRADNKGTEIMIETYFFNNLRTTLSYTLMDFIFKDYLVEYENNTYQLIGNKVPGVPQQIFLFQIDYINNEGLAGNIKFSFTDEYFANDFNGTPPGSELPVESFVNKSYLKTDLKMGYNFKFDFFESKIFLGINNLFDIKYNGSVVPNAFGQRYFEPAPGRNWYAGLQIVY